MASGGGNAGQVGLGELHEHLLHVGQRVSLFGGPCRIGHTPGESGGDEEERSLLESLRDGSQLGDHLAAVAALIEHHSHAAHLPLGTP